MYKVSGVKNIQKTIILLENNNNICEMVLREYKLKKKKQYFIDNKLARNFLAIYYVLII